MLKTLILGGSTEASELARMLAGDATFDAMLSLAGRTRAPRLPPIACRIGGFGGAEGLADYLRAERVAALVDATHPFAARMSRNARQAAGLAGVAHLRIDRAEWRPVVGDRWEMVADMAAAAMAIGTPARRVLLTIGQRDLAAFCHAPEHSYVIRSVDAPAADSLPPIADIIAARGPFAEPDERALLTARGIEVIVTKNSGGSATAAKLAAARALGIRVVMVARPAGEPGERVGDAGGAMRWLVRHAGAMERGV